MARPWMTQQPLRPGPEPPAGITRPYKACLARSVDDLIIPSSILVLRLSLGSSAILKYIQ